MHSSQGQWHRNENSLTGLPVFSEEDRPFFHRALFLDTRMEPEQLPLSHIGDFCERECHYGTIRSPSLLSLRTGSKSSARENSVQLKTSENFTNSQLDRIHVFKNTVYIPVFQNIRNRVINSRRVKPKNKQQTAIWFLFRYFPGKEQM